MSLRELSTLATEQIERGQEQCKRSNTETVLPVQSNGNLIRFPIYDNCQYQMLHRKVQENLQWNNLPLGEITS